MKQFVSYSVGLSKLIACDKVILCKSPFKDPEFLGLPCDSQKVNLKMVPPFATVHTYIL